LSSWYYRLEPLSVVFLTASLPSQLWDPQVLWLSVGADLSFCLPTSARVSKALFGCHCSLSSSYLCVYQAFQSLTPHHLRAGRHPMGKAESGVSGQVHLHKSSLLGFWPLHLGYLGSSSGLTRSPTCSWQGHWLPKSFFDLAGSRNLVFVFVFLHYLCWFWTQSHKTDW
jgi:hypothetical protein